MNTNSEKYDAISVTQVKKIKGIPLRRKLILFMLPTVLVPLFVVTAIEEKIAEKKTRQDIVTELEGDTLLATKASTTFIRESFEITDLVASEPYVIEAMREGSRLADEQNLPQLSVEELEAKFAQTKLLNTQSTDRANKYLEKVVESTGASAIYATEKDGYNVAYSSKPKKFVERDEGWWIMAKQQGKVIDEHKEGESVDDILIDFAESVVDPDTGKFIGVLEVAMPAKRLNLDVDTFLFGDHKDDYEFQIIDSQSGFILNDINSKETDISEISILGGDAILQASQILTGVTQGNGTVAEAQASLSQVSGFTKVKVESVPIFNSESVTAKIDYQGFIYKLSTVPGTNLVSIGNVHYDVIDKEGRTILLRFALIAILLGLIATLVMIFLAGQIAQPIVNLSSATKQASTGNYQIRAKLLGSMESKILADNFNTLVTTVDSALQEQENLAHEQKQEKEKLQMGIMSLIEDIADASDGDLTVRASLKSMEMSTVADLFNAIIDNLQDIVIEAKQSSGLVGSALKENETAVHQLAEQAIAEAEETRKTLVSIEEINQSIKTVAANASQVEQIADDTYNRAVESTNNMSSTVNSIIALKNTVSETANKMELLGESSEKISQAVTLIEEIALKTNVLAVNARVEARRAGEHGQGFTIVAEQVGSLAEQSVEAAKEIANIVTAIQLETREVSDTMRSGTIQAVESTKLVAATKDSLGLMLEKSREINHLVGSITQATVSQANTSQNVTDLMQKIANSSEVSSQSSKKVAQSIRETAQVAQKLESTVAQFKVAESTQFF